MIKMLRMFDRFKTVLHTMSTKSYVFGGTDSIKIQPVGIEHNEDVISIQRKVYGGIDKLPGLYRTMLRNHYAYTATLNGRHVGYLSVMFVDDGETMIGKAVRVSDDQKGRRIGHQLQRHVEHQHKSDKRIKRTAYTSMIKGMTGKVETGTAGLISIRNIMYFKGKQDRIQQIAPNQGRVHLLKKEELRQIFRKSWENKHLFPDKRLMVDLVPYRLRESNVDILCDEHCHVLYSRADQSEGPKFCSSIDQSESPGLCSKIDQSEGPALLTVGYAYHTPKGYFCSIDIYGHLTEELFDKHVQQHAQECKGKGMDMVWFGCVYFKDRHDESNISRVMEKYGLIKDGSYLLYLVEETGRF